MGEVYVLEVQLEIVLFFNIPLPYSQTVAKAYHLFSTTKQI